MKILCCNKRDGSKNRKTCSNDLLIIIKCIYLLFFNHFETVVHFIIKITFCRPIFFDNLKYLNYLDIISLYPFIIISLIISYAIDLTCFVWNNNVANKNNTSNYTVKVIEE